MHKYDVEVGLDDIYTNDAIILNRLFSRKYHKLRYLTYPLFQERVEYLQIWEDKGAVSTTLRAIAAYQLHLIDYLHVEDGRMVTETNRIQKEHHRDKNTVFDCHETIV